MASLWHAGPPDKSDVPFSGTLRQTFYKYVCVLSNVIIDNIGGRFYCDLNHGGRTVGEKGPSVRPPPEYGGAGGPATGRTTAFPLGETACLSVRANAAMLAAPSHRVARRCPSSPH